MSAPEEWRIIPGFDAWYEASDEGRIRSWRTPAKLDVRRSRPRELPGSHDGKGYLRVKLCHPVMGKVSVAVHQLVLAAHVSSRPTGMICDHINAVRSDNRLANLRWVTAGDNVRHAARSGRMGAWAHSRLNAARATEIRERRARGASLRELAVRFGVSESAVSRVVLGKGWKEVSK